MARVLVIGGGGMVGQKLARRLSESGIADRLPEQLDLIDLAYPNVGAEFGRRMTGSLTDDDVPVRLAAERYDVIFHLAAVVSGEAEKNFGKGWQINLFSVWSLLQALKTEHEASGGAYCPRLVFASTTGVYGPPYDGPVSDRQICEPRSSYGAQKVCAEMLLSDFSRKGAIDGIALRLPTISVRPGQPNAAASSFFSNIIREPLNGRAATLPAPRDLRHMHASPRSAARFFTHAAALDTELLAGRRALNMPSVTCSVDEQIAALRFVAGGRAADLIHEEPDPFVCSIVSTWPEGFEAGRARELGFSAEDSFEEIIRIYVEDDLPIDSAR